MSAVIIAFPAPRTLAQMTADAATAPEHVFRRGVRVRGPGGTTGTVVLGQWRDERRPGLVGRRVWWLCLMIDGILTWLPSTGFVPTPAPQGAA